MGSVSMGRVSGPLSRSLHTHEETRFGIREGSWGVGGLLVLNNLAARPTDTRVLILTQLDLSRPQVYVHMQML